MTTSTVALEECFDLAVPAGDEVLSVAKALCARAAQDPSFGVVVIVARAANGELRSVGSEVGPLRAAVSVAVAGGHDRLWSGCVDTDTVEMPVHALPEVVRTAAAPIGLTHAYVGCIQDDGIAAVAVWFTASDVVASSAARTEAMQLLAAAAERQRDYFAARDEAYRLANPQPLADELASTVRTFDPTDPGLDSVTGLATGERFDAALGEYESDEATLIVVDLDDVDAVREQHGIDAVDTLLREIADRLVSACRRNDLIARTGESAFALLLHDASRASGLQVAKRLLDVVAEPLPFSHGPESITATIALAHQSGLVDTEELLESADTAIASGKRAGSNRLVIAS